MTSARTVFLWLMAGSLGLSALMGIYAVFGGGGWEFLRLLFTALIVAGYSLPMLACAATQERGRLVALMWVGIAAGALGMACALLAMWSEGNDSMIEPLVRGLLGFTTFGVWAGLFGVLGLADARQGLARGVRLVTRAALTVLAAGILYFVLIFHEPPTELVQLGVALAILGGCGAIATPVLARIEAGRRKEQQAASAALPNRVQVALTCPRCGAAQTVPCGESRCTACRLQIRVEVEEPRCLCGYSLYKLDSDRCPECGRPVEAAQRWAAPA